MKNKIVIIFMAIFLFFIVLLVGCVETTTLNGKVTIQSGRFITISYYPIELSYDTATEIVYIKNYTYHSNYVYTPYYAPNGLPYRYNHETNTFEEIDENDIGRTLTCIGFKPMDSEVIDKIGKKYHLYT